MSNPAKSTEQIQREQSQLIKVAAALRRYGSLRAKGHQELKEENARLKRMYSNLAMQLDTAKYSIEKKL